MSRLAAVPLDVGAPIRCLLEASLTLGRTVVYDFFLRTPIPQAHICVGYTMHTLPAIDDPQVQCLVDEAGNIKAYLLYLDYEKEFTTIADQRCVRILGFLLLQ